MKFLVILTCLYSLPVFSAADNSELKYFKCYSILVGGVPEQNDPLLIKVKNKEYSGAKACVELLNHAKFNSNGELINQDAKAKAILQNLYSHYQGRFTGLSFFQENSEESYVGARNFYSSPALYYLQSLFHPNTRFDNVFKSSTPLMGIREGRSSTKDPYLVDVNLNYSNLSTNLSANILLELGLLKGIKPDNRSIMAKDNQGVDQNITTHFGGGILGVAGLLLKMREDHGPSNGGGQVYRTFTKKLMESLLCRSYPLMKAADVQNLVRPNSDLPYRQSGECVKCHAAMDPMSSFYRNITPNKTQAPGNLPVLSYTMPTGQANYELPLNGDPDFYKGVPAGTFRFVNINGQFEEYQGIGPGGLGEILANQVNDIYYCEANRILTFLTGFEVPFFDPSEANAPSRSLEETQLLEFIKQLGGNLKTTSDYEKLFGDIFASKYF